MFKEKTIFIERKHSLTEKNFLNKHFSNKPLFLMIKNFLLWKSKQN